MSFLHSLKAIWTSGKGIALGLPDADSTSNPIDLFDRWFSDAKRSGLFLPEAMTVASATLDHKPSARMVLLKQVDQDGFVFFTNYGSRKANELDANPQAALLFHWPILQRQVRIEGPVQRVSAAESAAYFHSRPRGSQIGAWASRQSQLLDSPAELKSRVKDKEKEFGNEEIPYPPFWGGYRVIPERMEFWQGRPFRLHDRLIFERSDSSWATHRLYP